MNATRRHAAFTLALAAITANALTAAPVHAADWRWSLTPYAWATDIGVDARLSDREIVDTTIPVSDLIDDLDTIFQVRAEGQTGRYGFALDVFDVRLSDDAWSVALPEGAGSADLHSEVGMTIFDVGGFADVSGDPRFGLSVLAGTRVLDQRATLEGTIETTPGSYATRTWDAHDTIVDGLVGLRMKQPFTRHWAINGQVDASTGGTDHTWSAGSALQYVFGENGRHAVSAGYRTMEVDFEDAHGVDTNLKLSGVLVGFRTSF